MTHPAAPLQIPLWQDQRIAVTPTAGKLRDVLGSNLPVAPVWADCARSVHSKAGTEAVAKAGQNAMVAFVQPLHPTWRIQ